MIIIIQKKISKIIVQMKII